jgi:phage terminase small subunit
VNALQRRFAEEFVTDHHGQNAAIRAGYSAKRARHTASELLARPDVAAYVAELETGTREALGVTHLDVVQGFWGYHERALAGEVPASVGVRGLELVAKSLGMFVERSTVEHSGEVVYTLTLDRDLEG